MNTIEKEKLESLNGDRPDKSRSAVRLKAVSALLEQIPVDPTGDTAADIKAIYVGLNAMRIAIRQ